MLTQSHRHSDTDADIALGPAQVDCLVPCQDGEEREGVFHDRWRIYEWVVFHRVQIPCPDAARGVVE